MADLTVLDADSARRVAAQRAAGHWDAEAHTYDDEPHHALAALPLREAWWDVLEAILPPPPAVVVDLGCGTGSISVLLAAQGYDVVGLDVSTAMLARATTKADTAGVHVRFVTGDASRPALRAHSLDVVLTRHVVWALHDPAVAIDRWFDLLAPGGMLVLVEGLWPSGAGLTSDTLRALTERDGVDVDVLPLDDPRLWGHPVADSRYVLTART
jgi:ubiquinone/menaquinone biosynthesis C-methylase UbiE